MKPREEKKGSVENPHASKLAANLYVYVSNLHNSLSFK